jgi:SAM-dependent methyltransferase
MTAVQGVCPCCLGPLVGRANGDACERCGDFPRVGGVSTLVSQPSLTIADVRERAIRGWVDVAKAEAEAARAPLLVESDREALARSIAGLKENQALLETVAAAAISHPRDERDERALAPLFARPRGWSFDELLSYFYFDWCAARDPVRDRFLSESKDARGSALVLGCGACGVVRDFAGAFEEVVAVDLSLTGLLFAKRLLDGESARVHVPQAAWKAFTLRGAEPPVSNVKLVVADGARLPFADASFAVVVTQYLLDVVPDPAAVLREINRVLAPGGVWLNDGLPFRFHGQPAALRARTGDVWPAVMARFGFDAISIERRSHPHLDQRESDPWASLEQHEVVHAVLRKREAVAASPAHAAMRTYFAGDPSPLFALTPALARRETLRVQRRVDARSVETAAGPTIVLGDLEARPSNDETFASALALLVALDGRSTVERVLAALGAARGSARERDVVLALDALLVAGLFE